MMSMGRRSIVIAEADIEAKVALRDWAGRDDSQSEFAKTHDVKVAPTVMFFDERGRSAAAPIIGLSRDFFGAYIDQRIQVALRESRRRSSQ